MKETPEQLAQRIQDARGYIVMRSTDDWPVGHVFLGAYSDRVGHLKCKLVVIDKTDFADWAQQHAFAECELDELRYPFYIRVIAE